MKNSNWIIIGFVLTISVGGMIWIERSHTRSQDVTMYELVLPKSALKPEDIVYLDVLNESFRDQNLEPAAYFQGFQTRRNDGQNFAGSFSYSQIDAVRRKLDQVSRKRADIDWKPVFEGRVRYHKPVMISNGASLKLSAEPNATPVEATIQLSPDSEPLVAQFYDGHTMLFGDATGEELRILFITVIFPPESTTRGIVKWLERIMD